MYEKDAHITSRNCSTECSIYIFTKTMAQFFEYEFRPIFHDFYNFRLFNTMLPEQFFNDVLQPNYSCNFHQGH